ncbi:MFS transporter [Georgenia subflava]|uniref:MFS transporter n=1 Tax=Georgenia subflava TaxID=1622177 RepID=A0A6N7EKE8_9MICO|nr:MFS transporter [Georgenia subflava]MPV37523.1 MFS transporter [Georgenia subflava]
MRAQELYARLVRPQGDATDDLASEAARDLPRNGLRQVAANGLQSIGDEIVNAKTVLPWLLSALGAPGALVGLLVPVRESGSMLPQAALLPWVQGRRVRKWAWVAGAAGQAAATAVMAGAAATASGTAAGAVVLVALAVFALARALTSLAGKDVLGRTVPKGQRGQITGLATVLSGVVAITAGLGIRLLGGDDVTPLAVLLGAAALAWVAATAVYAGIREPADEPVDPGPDDVGWLGRSWALLRSDVTFRRFVVVRTLLLVSALSPPFIVALAARGGGGLAGLGPFVIASGVASLVGGRLFGRLADRSSRRVMIWGAATASVVVLALLALYTIGDGAGAAWIFPLGYLLLALTHTGVRVARKTYVVDMAEGDRRTEYVAVANTAMGVLLLVAGAVSSGLALLGTEVALLFLAALGLAGVVAARSLPEVSS